jgi:SelR domain
LTFQLGQFCRLIEGFDDGSEETRVLKEVSWTPVLRNYRKTPEAISRLTAEQFRVTQQSATELPNPGRYLHNTESGIHADIVLGEPLFASSDKYESGCG